MKLAEMKHILRYLGEGLTEEELEQFFSLLDNGTDHISMNELVSLLEPQSTKDLYSKDIPRNISK